MGIPCAVLLNGQRAGGDGLGRVPSNQPKSGVMTTGEVNTGNLQVSTVDITLMERYGTVGDYFLERTAAHGIICALDGCGTLCGGGAELRPISAAFDSFIDADTLACLGGGNSATNIYMNNRGDNPFG